MKLSPRIKEDLKIILMLRVIPLLVYWIVLRKNHVNQQYLASLELTEEWKKEMERLNAEYDKEHNELDFLHYVD